MFVLGIESTCDETAAAVVKDGREILSNVISSQADIHKEFGGVFPEVACRSHIDMIIPVIDEALNKAGIKKEDINLISVANGPGLIGAVLIGVNTAKGLALALNCPLIGVNHLEAHLYASIMNNLDNLRFPSLGVIVSGGHTVLLKITDIGKYELLGKTIDDAVGEAFDKTASILDLPYPGGPEIEKLAKEGDETFYNFTAGKVKTNPFDFSFSGLKTKILYTAKGYSANRHSPLSIPEEEKKHIAASFQKTALSDIVNKATRAVEKFECKAVYLGGGVSNNRRLRDLFKEKDLSVPVFWPSKGLSLDNAAMIAGLGYQKLKTTDVKNNFAMKAFARSAFISGTH